MVLRRRVWLCPEGWYYLAVLAFIIGGAVLRNINLLVVLAGMMAAPLVLNWRMVMLSLRKIDVRRKPPRQASAGEPLTIELTVFNDRRYFSSWLLRLEDRLEFLDAPPLRLASGRFRRARLAWRKLRALLTGAGVSRPSVVVSQALPRQATLAVYRVTIHRRGRYRLGPVSASTRFPLGLLAARLRFPEYDELIVVPRLGRLTHRWAALTEAESLGDQRRHPQRGMVEGEYYALRPWQSGDSQRWIHWRTTAKLNAPTVRQFERQRSQDLSLLLDAYLPAEPSDDDIGRLELAISLAATAIADACQRGAGRLAFTIAGAEPQQWIAPASPLLADELLLALAVVKGGPSTDLKLLAEHLQHPQVAASQSLTISPRREQQQFVDLGSASASPPKWIDVGGAEISDLFALE